ncbi:uncharacterized protein LOC119662636 [Teleopsis dalmanni]|uniref:uncharacterized protein LOC119662636 n=1 Tax=Teleopsis dalmanni TaxID=139649 RepID=UPI0018CD93FB|nr:uncharacterized protein LOC119662636 [Teleopsis dalmanni]XP_037928224.1 uncharacterized protein LOC119662636 [Teleopsis dalmanni]
MMDDLIDIEEQLASMSINSKNVANKSNGGIENMVKKENSLSENIGRRIMDASDLILSSIATKKKVRCGVCSLKRLGNNRNEVSTKRSLKHNATRRSLFSEPKKIKCIDVNGNAFNKTKCIGEASSLGVVFNCCNPEAYKWSEHDLTPISDAENFGNAFNKTNCIGEASSLGVVFNCYNPAAYKLAEQDLTLISDDAHCESHTKTSKMDVHYCN